MPEINPQVGLRQPDGSIYLGFHNGSDWFVTAEDAKDEKSNNRCMSFKRATQYAHDLRAHNHNDWILPPKDILNEMFKNKRVGAFSGTYNEISPYRPGFGPGGTLNNSHFYMSSTCGPLSFERFIGFGMVWVQRFDNPSGWVVKGMSGWTTKFMGNASVRCVRAVSRP
jgi:hypothetical protein